MDTLKDLKERIEGEIEDVKGRHEYGSIRIGDIEGPFGGASFEVKISHVSGYDAPKPLYRNCVFTIVYTVEIVGKMMIPTTSLALYAENDLNHMGNQQGQNDLFDDIEERPNSLRHTIDMTREFLTRPPHPTIRRQHAFKASARHEQTVQHAIENYVPKHQWLFDIEDWSKIFVDEVCRALAILRTSQDETTREKAIRSLVKQEHVEVFSFPLFDDKFCDALCEEVENYERSDFVKLRPNSMNRYGVIVNMIGLRAVIDRLQREMMEPISKILFPKILGSDVRFTAHHSFVVKYKVGEDVGLDMHTDNSDVTFNINLGRKFEGGGLTICGNQGSSKHRKFNMRYRHVKGRCLVHAGHRRHGADNITSGERMNLIVWNTSRYYRASKAYETIRMQRTYEKESGMPDRECLSYTHDRDFSHFREYPEGKQKYSIRAWCPPKHAEYDGYGAVATSAAGSSAAGLTEDEDDGGRRHSAVKESHGEADDPEGAIPLSLRN